jgi:hypothetical protein
MYYRAPGCDTLIHGLSLLDRSRYLAAVQQLLDGPFQLNSVNDKLDRWSAQIADSVATDTHGPNSQAFQNAVVSLKSNVALLRQRLQSVRDGASSAPAGLKLDVVNGFEGVTSASLASGALGECNSTSTVTYGPNQTNPISGSEDARIDFTFRDQSENASDAWQQWADVNFAFQGWSVDLVKAGITEIHFTARADQSRTVRVDIASPNNSQTNQGICLGWDVPLTAQPTAVVVKLVNAAIPGWAATRPNPPHDDPKAVFGTATGVVFRPQPVGVGSSGFFPPGTTDTGFVQIDDVSFVSQ